MERRLALFVSLNLWIDEIAFRGHSQTDIRELKTKICLCAKIPPDFLQPRKLRAAKCDKQFQDLKFARTNATTLDNVKSKAQKLPLAQWVTYAVGHIAHSARQAPKSADLEVTGSEEQLSRSLREQDDRA